MSTIDEEHRAAIDWLNSITDDNYNFFGIEVRLFKIGDSALAPQFDIVAKPNNWSKQVKKQVSVSTETENLRLEFWNSFYDYVDKKNLDVLKHGNPSTDWNRQFEWFYNTLMELHKIMKPHYGEIRGIK